MANVDNFNTWQDGRPMTAAQFDPVVAPRINIGQGFKRRGCRCQYNRNIAQMRTGDCHVAGVINHAVFLLKRMFVFFVDHNKGKITKGQEKCRPRANNQLHRTICHRAPCITTARLPDFGMPKGRDNTKPVAETLQPLGRQGNFRQQNNHLLTFGQGRTDRLKINFCLARPRDAIEQCAGKSTCIDPVT